jgi:hypothetical protein
MSLLHARYLEPEPFRAALRGGALSAGRLYASHFEAQGYGAALAGTVEAGELAEEPACALVDAVLQVGLPGGVLDVGEDRDVAQRFLAVAGTALDDVTLASQLLRGGWLGRLGRGRFQFGSLPLRVVRRQVTRTTLQRARERVEVGWDSELLNLLESAALRAERETEHHLVLVAAERAAGRPAPEVAASPRPQRGPLPDPEGTVELAGLLLEASRRGAHDVVLQPGRPAVLHAPGGTTAHGAPLTRAAVSAVAEALGRPAEEPGTVVLALQVEGLGPVRASVSAAGVVLRLLGPRPLPVALEPLAQVSAGLVVLGGVPGSGRSTALVTLLQRAQQAGALTASLEEPVWLKGSPFQWDAGPGQEAAFLRAVRTSPASVVAFDLLDDARGAELALDVALEGRLVLCTLRGSTLAEVLQRLAVVDASHHRLRVAEHLAAVALLDGAAAALLKPSPALRRHLRDLDGPPPAALLA